MKRATMIFIAVLAAVVLVALGYFGGRHALMTPAQTGNAAERAS